MMADDMRREVAALPWVRGIHLKLDDHMYSEAVNRGMAEGLSFREAFGDDRFLRVVSTTSINPSFSIGLSTKRLK